MQPAENKLPSSVDADLELMARVAKADPFAQRELVIRLADRVRRICGLLVPQSADADDAAQLALIEVLEAASNFRAPGNLEHWADRISVRTALRYARRLRRMSSMFERWPEFDALPGILQDWFGKERLARDLEDYLAMLPQVRREAFVLKYALGYTVEEISALTQAPLGTVKDRLVLARKQLRRVIDRDIRLNARTRK